MMTAPAPPTTARGPRARRLLKLLAGLSLLVGFALLSRSGLLEGFSLDALQSWVAGAGMVGPVLYVALFTALQPLGLSAHVFLVAAGLLWPTPVGLPLGMVGLLGGCSASFWGARLLGREAVQERIPASLERHESALAARGFRTVVGLRLALFTFFPLSMLMGVSKVSWRDYLLGTALGCAPVAVVDVVLAQQVAAWLAP